MSRMVALGVLTVSVMTIPLSGVRAQTAESPPDPRAVLEASVGAMGGSAPSTSRSFGTIQVTRGTTTESGHVTTVTRSSDHTRETYGVALECEDVVFSDGRAAETCGGRKSELPKERVITSRTTHFPLLELEAALGQPDGAFQYIALEAVGGVDAHHVRYWRTFATQPELEAVAPCSTHDVWIDAATDLPVKLAFDSWGSRGTQPPVPVTVEYGDYRRVGSVLHPFVIEKSLNGVAWQSIRFTEVELSVALPADTFSLE